MRGKARATIALLVLLALALAGTPTFPVTALGADRRLNGWYWPGDPGDSYSGWMDFRSSPPNWHLAKDFHNPAGSAVKAIDDGTVVDARMDLAGYPGAIIILHRTATGAYFRALYGHIHGFKVHKGDKVTAGQTIGYIDSNHVHFSIHPGTGDPPDGNPWRGHTYIQSNTYGFVDPVAFMKKNSPWGTYIAPPLSARTLEPKTGVWQRQPDISGKRVVWREGANGYGNIRGYDLQTAKGSWVSTSPLDDVHPAADATLTVWQALAPSAGLFLRRGLETPEPLPGTGSAGSPSFDGRRVVWESVGPSGNYDIYMRDLASGETTALVALPGQQRFPSISRNILVFQDDRAGNWEIYAYDIARKTYKRLTESANDQQNPSVSGSRVVWEDWTEASSGGTNRQIWLLDGLASTPRRLAAGGSEASYPSIDGTRIVWTDSGTDRSGEIRLYDFGARLSLTAAGVPVAMGPGTKLTGALRNWAGKPFLGALVRLDSSPDGVTWSPRATAMVTTGGAYSFTVSPSTRTYYRVRFAGDGVYAVSYSSPLAVVPRHSVGTPTAPSSPVKGKWFLSSGYLKPRHSRGVATVVVRSYRYENGVWKLKKTFPTRNGDYSGYTRYYGYVSLPWSGRWRLQAYAAADWGHSYGVSPARFVTLP